MITAKWDTLFSFSPSFYFCFYILCVNKGPLFVAHFYFLSIFEVLNIFFSSNLGYSIFVVFGNLPESDADKILRANPVSRTTRKPVPVIQISDIEDEEDLDLKKALRLSLGEEVASTSNSKDCRGSSSSRLSRYQSLSFSLGIWFR